MLLDGVRDVHVWVLVRVCVCVCVCLFFVAGGEGESVVDVERSLHTPGTEVKQQLISKKDLVGRAMVKYESMEFICWRTTDGLVSAEYEDELVDALVRVRALASSE